MPTSDLQLDDPSARQRALRAIHPTRDSARQNRAIVLLILAEEMKYRACTHPGPGEKEGEVAYFEHLYWCSFLLYLAGDPRDALLIWQAKHIDFDTDVGMHGQCLVGAGFEATRRFLADNQAWDVLAYIEDMKSCGDLDDLPEWEQWRARYFYGEDE